jgi:hypothetical protein
MIERFNHVSSWVASEVVKTQNFKKRVSVIKSFIWVAQCAREMRNYNTMLEITAGLNMAAVQRLRRTWKVG